MNHDARLHTLQRQAEEKLAHYLATCRGPEQVLDAMRYSLLGGGKLVRPVLLVSTWEALQRPGALDPWPAACALEFIHTYSLIHDDLPAMDDDDLRRGRPSCHKAFGEALAILAGDGLLTESFRLLADEYRPWPRQALQLTRELARAAGCAGMVGGQALDISYTGSRLEQEQLETMHRLKTGALLGAAVRCGAILAGAPAREIERASDWAGKIGLAFQVADDLLDVVATSENLGKTAGKDSCQGKSTYVDLLGVDACRHYLHDLLGQARCQIDALQPGSATLCQLTDYLGQRVERHFA